MGLNRKSFGSILDETVNQMESDVRILKNQQATLQTNVLELEAKRNKISEEILNLEKEHSERMKECKSEIELIMKSAQEKLNKASLKDSELSIKLENLNEKIKESENIIKSNQGLQKNLNIQLNDLKFKFDKLLLLNNMISDTIKDLQ